MGLYTEIKKRGLFGRKKQIEAYLKVWFTSEEICYSEDQPIGINTDNYLGIRLWNNPCGHRIGEFISRFLIIVKESEKMDDEYLNVMVDSRDDCSNKALVQIMSRTMPIINHYNVSSWEKVLLRVKKIDFTHFEYGWDRYNSKDVYTFEWSKRLFELTEEEEKKGLDLLESMGLKTPFVCISSRDRAFLDSIYPPDENIYHDHRDSDFKNRKKAIDYLSEKGIHSVRMGKVVSKYYDFSDCIEYARDYYNELLDVYLFNKCKFVVIDTNGLMVLPICNNGNVIITNLTPVLEGTAAIPSDFNGLLLYKKMFSRIENRYLNLYEMVEADSKFGACGNVFRENGIEFVENTSDEILEAVQEMNSRIDGSWIDTEESIYRQNKFKEFRNEMVKRYTINAGSVLQIRMADGYLKRNWEIFGLE